MMQPIKRQTESILMLLQVHFPALSLDSGLFCQNNMDPGMNEFI